MAQYDSSSLQSRRALAVEIQNTLFDIGFDRRDLKEEFRSRECVFGRLVKDNIVICVFTTVEGGECRERGTDAIRVVGFYVTSDGNLRALAKSEKKVARSGTTQTICLRMLQRVAEVEEAVNHPTMCRCGRTHVCFQKGQRGVHRAVLEKA